MSKEKEETIPALLLYHDGLALCPKCRSDMIGVEYSWDTPEHYDGVSEWRCSNTHDCGIRIGRWTLRELKAGEVEKRYGGL